MGAEFSQFMFKHKIPATAASFSIGSASAEMAKTMASDMVLPVIFGVIGLVHPVSKAPKFQLGPFANSVVVWLCVVMTSYLLMEYVFARCMIGITTTVLDKDDKKILCKAREEAVKPLKKAKRAVQSVVDGISGAPGATEYATVSASDDEHASAAPQAEDHKLGWDGPRAAGAFDGAAIAGAPGGSSYRRGVAHDTAPSDFDGSL